MMISSRTILRHWPSAGVFGGSVAWSINTVAGYALVPWTCGHHTAIAPILAVLLAAMSLAFGAVSAKSRHSREPETPPGSSEGGEPHRFMGLIGLSIAVFFALVILVQGSAGIVLNGCER